MSDEKTDRELRVVLEDEVFKKIDLLKEFHGIRNNTEIIRFLITTKHREIQEHSTKLNDASKDTPLPKKTIETIMKNMLKVFENH